jgi:protein gp37
VSEHTSIEWCDHTWSPWEGCQKVSPGCDHCYAEARNLRFARGANWGPGAPRRRTADWTKPRLWNRKAAAAGQRVRVFPSLCDPFDNAVDEEWRADFFSLIQHTPHLQWHLLTKRIGNAAKLFFDHGFREAPPNVSLGATVVNQEEADRDIQKLLATPARLRYLCLEPLLGPVDLRLGSRNEVARIDWIIMGGESGAHARPMHLAWAEDVVRQCLAAGVPVFVKQLGARPINRSNQKHPISDRKGANWDEWPIELRLRLLPELQP